MSKKTIRVHTPFTFSFEDGTSQYFEAGEHVVDENVAGHWFVTAHAEVTGSAKASADLKEFKAQIDSLNAQLAEKDNAHVELQQSAAEKDAIIANLNAQLAALQPSAVTTPAPEADGKHDGKKQKPADSK